MSRKKSHYLAQASIYSYSLPSSPYPYPFFFFHKLTSEQGFCFGPPFWGPLSEKFGRKMPMLIGSGGAAVFSLMPALGQSIPTILIGRFIAGSFGAAPATIVSGASTDNWHAVGRGINLTVAVGSIFGAPLFAPIIGGFIAKSVTWRWTMWFMIILGGTVTAFCTIFLPETYAPVLLKRRTKRLRKDTGDMSIRCSFDNEKTALSVICNVYLVRPWRMPFRIFVFNALKFADSPHTHRAYSRACDNISSLHLRDLLSLP